MRIARACREMHLESVLAYSESDDIGFARRFFDDAVSLGPGDARETYLNVGKVIDAARQAGADALHPGYGFLSERAELAEACENAGIIFVGPKPQSIAAMGSKSEARHLMQQEVCRLCRDTTVTIRTMRCSRARPPASDFPS